MSDIPRQSEPIRDHVRYAIGVESGLSASTRVGREFRDCWMLDEAASIEMACEILTEEHTNPTLREAVEKEREAALVKADKYLASVKPSKIRTVKEIKALRVPRQTKGTQAKNVGWDDPRPCLHCDTVYTPIRGGQRYCSQRCSSRAAAKRLRDSRETDRLCKECKCSFTSSIANQLFCSPVCKRKAKHRREAAVMGVTRVCRTCQSSFVVTDARYPYWCNKQCVSAYKREMKLKKKQKDAEAQLT